MHEHYFSTKLMVKETIQRATEIAIQNYTRHYGFLGLDKKPLVVGPDCSEHIISCNIQFALLTYLLVNYVWIYMLASHNILS